MRVFRPGYPLQDIVRCFFRWILKDFAFRRCVQQVCVDREGRLAPLVLGDRNLVLFGKVDQLGPAAQVPFAPWGDDLNLGVERVGGQFETDLVVALAGGAV